VQLKSKKAVLLQGNRAMPCLIYHLPNIIPPGISGWCPCSR